MNTSSSMNRPQLLRQMATSISDQKITTYAVRGTDVRENQTSKTSRDCLDYIDTLALKRRRLRNQSR